MNIFGHHVERRVIALAGLDGLLFLLPFILLSLRQPCAGCVAAARPVWDSYQAIPMAMGLLLLSISIGLYNDDAARDFRTFLRRFLVSWQLIALIAALLLVLTGAGARGTNGWELMGGGLMFVMATQFGMHRGLSWWLSQPSMKRRLLVLGDSPAVEEICAFLKGPAACRFEHVQTIAGWGSGETAMTQVGNVVLASTPAARSLADIAVMLRCEEIVVAAEDASGLPADELLECKLRGMSVINVLDFWEREAGLIDVAKSHASWLAFSGGFRLGSRRRRAKRLVDALVAASVLVLTLPLCLLVALAIRLDSPGPIFYRQERVGLNGSVFRVWKFRSMRTDAEREGAPRWAMAADDRVTHVGRFIRKARIDEIPQVLNVLAGEMSFIGPRPERPFFVEQLRQLIPHYDLRHRVAPGITGWAQINYPYGASVEDARRKLAYDLYYVKRRDLLLDFVILLQTIRVVIFANGAR